ncbi:MAG: hypothetical protein ACRDQ7_19015 [Haloechinothrix sp.]
MATTTPQTSPQLQLPMPARYAMAACAVLAPVLFATAGALHPVEVGAEGREFVQQFADNLDAYTAPSWLYPIATLLWVPALLAVARVARSQSSSLGLIGMVLAFGLAIPVGLDSNDLAYVALDNGLDAATITALMASADTLPSRILGFTWLAGLIGLIVLGIAILRGRSAPIWAGVALIVAPLAIPASWFSGWAIGLTAAWVLLAIGFTGCALSLVTRREPQSTHVIGGAA